MHPSWTPGILAFGALSGLSNLVCSVLKRASVKVYTYVDKYAGYVMVFVDQGKNFRNFENSFGNRFLFAKYPPNTEAMCFL